MTPLEEIAHLADVPIDVEVELGRKIITIGEILGLETESVIRMPRSAGENMSFLVGGTLVGYGEIVIIEDAMGVRITDFSAEE